MKPPGAEAVLEAGTVDEDELTERQRAESEPQQRQLANVPLQMLGQHSC